MSFFNAYNRRCTSFNKEMDPHMSENRRNGSVILQLISDHKSGNVSAIGDIYRACVPHGIMQFPLQMLPPAQTCLISCRFNCSMTNLRKGEKN